MTKSHHITPKHALKIFDEAGGILDIDDKCPLAVSATDLANTINLALDQVLGEPVAEFIEASDEESFGSVSWLLCNREPLKTGDKLYTPKEQL